MEKRQWQEEWSVILSYWRCADDCLQRCKESLEEEFPHPVDFNYARGQMERVKDFCARALEIMAALAFPLGLFYSDIATDQETAVAHRVTRIEESGK